MKIGLSLSVGAAALTLFAQEAISQDNWTGFYTGVYADYSSADHKLSPGNAYVWDVKGFAGGLMFGYDQQLQNIVLGVEGDIGYSGVNGVNNTTWVVKMSGIDLAARARIGYALDKVLIYGTGGLAMTPIDVTYNGGSDVLHQTQVGWQAGAGIEFAVNEQLRLRGEYLYTDYGASNGLIPAPSVKFLTHTNTFRVGLSYKF